MAYADIDELIRYLRLDQPTAAATAAAQRSLDAAAGEITSYLGWDVNPPPVTLTAEQSALLATVNLDRAAEHWRLTPFGIVSQGPDVVPMYAARDSWYRHSRKLATLKSDWGVG